MFKRPKDTQMIKQYLLNENKLCDNGVDAKAYMIGKKQSIKE